MSAANPPVRLSIPAKSVVPFRAPALVPVRVKVLLVSGPTSTSLTAPEPPSICPLIEPPDLIRNRSTPVPPTRFSTLRNLRLSRLIVTTESVRFTGTSLELRTSVSLGVFVVVTETTVYRPSLSSVPEMSSTSPAIGLSIPQLSALRTIFGLAPATQSTVTPVSMVVADGDEPESASVTAHSIPAAGPVRVSVPDPPMIVTSSICRMPVVVNWSLPLPPSSQICLTPAPA